MKNKFKITEKFVDAVGKSELSEYIGEEIERESVEIEADEQGFSAILSKAQIDLEGEFVDPLGMDITLFNENPVIFWNHHKSEVPVGKAKSIMKNNDNVFLEAEFAPHQFAQDLYKMVKGGFISRMSAGFLKISGAILENGTAAFKSWVKENQSRYPDVDFMNRCATIYSKSLLIEASIVGIPANPGAEIVAVKSLVDPESVEILEKSGMKFVDEKPYFRVIKAAPAPVDPMELAQKAINSEIRRMLGKV